MSDQQPKRQKFKYTRELIKIALDDGMTQEEIGRLCRVQQSTVSAWKNGKSKATAQQLEPLMARYGARLRRSTARVYFLGNIDQQGNPKAGPPRIRVVEGPIVFRHVFTQIAVRTGRRTADLVQEPVDRWLVHEQPGSIFVLVRQTRRKLSPKDKEIEAKVFQASLYDMPYEQKETLEREARLPLGLRRWVETSDDAARWESTVEAGRALEDLLAWVDKQEFKLPHEVTTVRFLLRKALIEHGHPVPGVEYGAPTQ